MPSGSLIVVLCISTDTITRGSSPTGKKNGSITYKKVLCLKCRHSEFCVVGIPAHAKKSRQVFNHMHRLHDCFQNAAPGDLSVGSMPLTRYATSPSRIGCLYLVIHPKCRWIMITFGAVPATTEQWKSPKATHADEN